MTTNGVNGVNGTHGNGTNGTSKGQTWLQKLDELCKIKVQSILSDQTYLTLL